MTQRTRSRAKLKFLERFRQTGSITEAANQAGVLRKQHYRWLAKDEQYAEQFKEAEDSVTDALEQEAIKRARYGVEKPVGFHEVQKVVEIDGKQEVITSYEPWGFVHEYSDRLLEFLLKARKPGSYRERWAGEITGPGGGPVPVRFYLPDNGRDINDRDPPPT